MIARDSADTPRAGYCPQCFTSLAWSAQRCPRCGADLVAWSRLPYGQRLIHALQHPLAEVRMRAILALGARRDSEASAALAACALRHPADVVESLEVVHSLSLMPDSGQRRDALLRLIDMHAGHAVCEAARAVLEAGEPD